MSMSKGSENKPLKQRLSGITRRDLLKSLFTLPVLGLFGFSLYKKLKYDYYLHGQVARELGLGYEPAPVISRPSIKSKDALRLGIIGFGGRGEHLLRAAGFPHPEVIEEWQQGALINRNDTRLEDYFRQEDLNIVVNGICDVFDVRAERAISASANGEKLGLGGKPGNAAKRYRNYMDLINAKDIDAVIIATPDHWHARMAIEAARAGKHVYVEKGMTRTVEEALQMVDEIKNSNIVFQLGHQGRQTESYILAKDAIDKDVLGKITLVEVCTNRNTPDGAWVYDIHPEASPETINWYGFLGDAPKRPFSLERFFRWRCWWDYGTGLSGDLFTHEYDAINQILELGIPDAVNASGGVYYYKDGREVPDVYHVNCEYPRRNLTLMYSASLASSYQRGKVIMGHDASMELGNTIRIYPDPNSSKYKKKIESGIIDLNLPLYSYTPGVKGVDAITSATEQYFAGRGLLYTYRGGRRIDTTHLHVKEWIDAIRSDGKTSCNIDRGFEEAISAHMGTISLKNKRKVFWDKDKNEVSLG